jgi:hypothetical protein
MKKKSVVAALVLAMGLVASGSTAASSHGSVCQPEGPLTLLAYNDYGVRPNQQQGEAAAVVCPLIRDTSSGDAINTVVMQVYDRHATQNVQCNLTLTDQNGVALYTQQQVTSGADSAPKQLQWTGINVGAYYGSIRCAIPGTAGTVAPYAGWASVLTTIYVD